MRKDLREKHDAKIRKKYGESVGDEKIEAIRLHKNAIQRKYNTSENGRATRELYKRSGAMAVSMKRHDLKRHYGLTPESWDAMFERQGRKCAACGSADPGRKSGLWCTDHDHAKGRGHARAIVCLQCNFVMGYAKDRIPHLQMVIGFLERVNDSS